MSHHTIPRHVSPSSRAWLKHLLDAFNWSPSEWQLAVHAAVLRDRADAAREQLAVEGLTMPTRDGGLRPHPCVIIARDSIALHARILTQLDLDNQEG